MIIRALDTYIGSFSTRTVCDLSGRRVYGEYNHSSLEKWLLSPEGKRTLNVPASDDWVNHDRQVHAHVRINTATRVSVHSADYAHVRTAQLNDDIMKPYSQLIPPILEAGLPVLLYQGQLDMRDGVAATMAWLPTMPWGKLPEWFAAPRGVWVSNCGIYAKL
jgi:carboxypeptidase C (cathepsin A)